MTITLNRIDAVNATITIDIVKEDYASEVEKRIKNLRKTTIIPGFRKGMAPLFRIRQIYEKPILVEELDKLVGNQLNAYIQEENLNLLGNPLPSDDEQQTDLDKENYSFIFDVGLMPQIEIKLSKKDKVPYYSIEVSDEVIDKQINEFKISYGSYENAAETEEKDVVKGALTELDENDEPKPDGLRHEEAVLMPEYIKNEEEKAKLLGAKMDTAIVFNPHKAYEGNTTEISSFLNINKDEVENYTGNFSLKIKEILRHKNAEINQELFDKVFEPGTVTTEEAFREKIKEAVVKGLIPNCNARFLIDACKYIEKKVGELKFPETFLKRQLQTVSPSEDTQETVEAEIPKIIEQLKSQLIKDRLAKDYKIEIEEADILNTAKHVAREQFARYGFGNVSEDILKNYIKDMLNKEETVRFLVNMSMDEKLIDLLKEQFTLETKTITWEEFTNLNR
ncbi:MAG: trigger factor [Dysgonamonadaceae bacterium]|nr:trigger factor [Dysgonamonadaceae bacterium]